jgi:thiol-disulfide isomerase/thioredoxin
MKKYPILTGILLLFTLSGFCQSVEVIDVKGMEKMIYEKTAKTKVINFWATWCRPCIEELSYFEAINQDPDFRNFEVVLVSLDFVEDLETKVKSFIDKKNLKSTIKLVDNVDYNSWIDLVDPSWSGAIPATLIVNNSFDKRYFYEKPFERIELENMLKEFETELNQTNK